MAEKAATAAIQAAKVGEAVLVPAAVSLGGTIGIVFLGVVAIGKLSYYIYQKVKKTNDSA